MIVYFKSSPWIAQGFYRKLQLYSCLAKDIQSALLMPLVHGAFETRGAYFPTVPLGVGLLFYHLLKLFLIHYCFLTRSKQDSFCAKRRVTRVALKNSKSLCPWMALEELAPDARRLPPGENNYVTPRSLHDAYRPPHNRQNITQYFEPSVNLVSFSLSKRGEKFLRVVGQKSYAI